jgi:ankyrin repeat protein
VVNAQDGQSNTPLHWAAFLGYREIAQELIAANADVGKQGDDGYTPLHWATFNDCREIAQDLIDAGADVNIQNNGGDAPLHCAAGYGYQEIVQDLIAAGADVNRITNKNKSALEIAVGIGKDAIANIIFDAMDQQRQKQERQTIAERLAYAWHNRLGVDSPVSSVTQYLMAAIVRLSVP